MAGGMEMLGGCDLRVAVPEAYFGVMEPKRGLFAGGGTTVRLPRQVPFPAAMEFLLCADRVPAEQALAFGLLNAVVPADELRAKAEEYAHRITANGPFAVRKTKESVLRGLAVDMKEAYRIESEICHRGVLERGRQGRARPPSPRSARRAGPDARRDGRRRAEDRDRGARDARGRRRPPRAAGRHRAGPVRAQPVDGRRPGDGPSALGRRRRLHPRHAQPELTGGAVLPGRHGAQGRHHLLG